ncbi:MAG: hypothetical protein A2X17_04485 [Bacteroidetes bacterium GWF2_41_61]|jgi:hypothetical protein|nr:MAG: hypothetical protein A2X20_02845 [Bacteroidetes bacterium GWE2_40_15]OFY30749.1 MAG: hypothetical protein A2X17_04485 [Bacteroidetes bacterium GWF2_41_61]PKP06751.1 MAG: hypothetical protein CVU10_04115 [Bacteroidetes bacterium HGW-Bacteroidetes-5]HBG24842.1 hypothetical protein [Rikenellaceae bacterium]HBZ25275.1 hypothetical protein [Rikenellaceae bacterium]
MVYNEINSKAVSSLSKFGLSAAILTTLLAIITFGMAVSTPPLSGPLCTVEGFTYPYLDIASRFPRDYLWMYPAILLSICTLILIIAVHQVTPGGKKHFSLVSVHIATISSLILILTYFVQISVIQPALLAGESDGISILSQYNPHGLFIVMEEAGFSLLILSLLFLAPVFSKPTGLERIIRWSFILGFIFALFAFVLISLFYGINREYRFEIAVITIAWIELIVSGVGLVIFFNDYQSV